MAMQEGAAVLQDCAAIANEANAWRDTWAAELTALKAARATADQLRESVHFQVSVIPLQGSSDAAVQAVRWRMHWLQ
jgi:hypothetical protein